MSGMEGFVQLLTRADVRNPTTASVRGKENVMLGSNFLKLSEICKIPSVLITRSALRQRNV